MTDAKIVKRIYWTHVGAYLPGDEYATFEEAVEAARATIVRFVYFEGTPSEKVNFSRAFVALRQAADYEGGGGIDEELVRWEVYTDRVALDQVKA